MLSAAASIELDAPAERVWQIVADLNGYTDWNPCFCHVRGTLRANDHLDVDLRLPVTSPLTRAVSALVLDAHRHRRLRWLLLSPRQLTADRSSGQIAVGVYDVEIVPLGPTRVRLVQRLALVPGSDGWPADRTELGQQVEAMNAALRDRVGWSSVNLSPVRQIEGTIRISSHRGYGSRDSSQRSGLLACVAELVGRRPRLTAA
jgi:hypothetical protein